MMHKITAPALEAAGAACLTVGAAMVYVPAGWLVAGTALVAKAFELDLRRSDRDRGRVG